MGLLTFNFVIFARCKKTPKQQKKKQQKNPHQQQKQTLHSLISYRVTCT